MSKAEKQTKTTKNTTQYVYAYVFFGGVLKQNHCVVGVSVEHPETTVFNELKKYYGNDVKGAFYKCSKSLEDIQAGITFKLSKFCLTEILFQNGFTETKKILLDITGLKQCTGTINVFHKKDEDEDDAKQEPEKDSKNEDDNKESVKVKSKKTENVDETKSKDKKEETKETKSKDKKEETKETKSSSKKEETKSKDKKVETKSSSKNVEIKKIDVDDSDSDSDSDNEGVKPKNNNTSIELSDESDESDEEDKN